MLYANSPHGGKITASPGAKGTCPMCDANLVPRCGQVNSWHWAHRFMEDCDSWYEPETEWHLGWKRLVQPAFCEFRLPPHRADILGNNATVIELQHSPISLQVIEEREQFYSNMIWLFDATRCPEERFEFTHEYNPQFGQFVSFRWKNRKRSVLGCKKPVFLDIGVRILQIEKQYHRRKIVKYPGNTENHHEIDGWGRLLTHSVFTERFLSQVIAI